MTNDGLKGFEEFLEVAEEVHRVDVAARKAGIRLVTAREVGIFYGPDAKPSVVNARIHRLPNLAEWEAQSIALQAHLDATAIELKHLKPKPERKPKVFNPMTLPINR